MQPLVSILIPVYNAEEWLDETLRCAMEQTWSNKEIIVIDDGSKDNSLQIAKRYENTSIKVIHQENQGGCAARNRAIEEAQGDFIQYLDADDLMEPIKIEAQIRRLNDEPSGTIASAPWFRFLEEPGDGGFLHPPNPSWKDFEDPLDWLYMASTGNAMLPSHGWLIPRTIEDATSPWKSEIKINQDGEYFARVLLNSSKIAYCPDAVVWYRSGIPGSVSRQFSNEVLRSRYIAESSIANHMLDAGRTRKHEQIAANHLQRFVHLAYPHLPELVKEVEREIEHLGGSRIKRKGSRIYKMIENLVGWKLAKRLQLWYYQLVHRKPL